jgi:hypothetical protein
LEACHPLKLAPVGETIVLGWGMETLAEPLRPKYRVIDVANSYSRDQEIPGFSSILQGEVVGSVNRAGQFIDSAALAFLAQEAGCIVTTLDGNPPPPLYTCHHYRRGGLVTAVSESVHQDILQAIQMTQLTSQK